jgi:hypothetical protein
MLEQTSILGQSSIYELSSSVMIRNKNMTRPAHADSNYNTVPKISKIKSKGIVSLMPLINSVHQGATKSYLVPESGLASP